VIALANMACTPLHDLSSYVKGGSSTRDAAIATPSSVDGLPRDAEPEELAPPSLAPMSSGVEGNVASPLLLVDSGVQESAEESASSLPLARFVRLVADSEVNGKPFTSIAEFDVLDDSGAFISRSTWIATADSAEMTFNDAGAEFAIDGDPATLWHTPWSTPELVTIHPHYLQVDLGEARELGGFRYLPRQDLSSDGQLADYRLLLSQDGSAWSTPVASGRFSASKQEQIVRIAAP